jgi:hypothetical protein
MVLPATQPIVSQFRVGVRSTLSIANNSTGAFRRVELPIESSDEFDLPIHAERANQAVVRVDLPVANADYREEYIPLGGTAAVLFGYRRATRSGL